MLQDRLHQIKMLLNENLLVDLIIYNETVASNF